MSSMDCLSELVQNIAFPALVLDEHRKVILSNSIETRAGNLSGSCVLGKSLADFFSDGQAGDLQDACLKALESKQPSTHRLELESADGLVEMTARMIPIFNVGSMSWNLILTLEEKPDGGGAIATVKAPDEGRAEQNQVKPNSAGEAEEFKTALRLLLREGATQLAALKDEITSKLPQEIMIMVEALKKTRLNKTQRSYVELLESNTRKLTEPFARRISNPMYKLSPQEAKIACLIRDGLTNKEMAKMLNLSKSTILTHRHHLRVKLGLKNKKQNLQTYLNSMEPRPPADSPSPVFRTTAL